MRILDRFDDFHPSKEPLVLALGNFDGLHLGHQKLLKSVIDSAKKYRGLSGLVTFREHPQTILHPSEKPPRLHSSLHKLWQLESLGLNLCFQIPFTKSFSQMSAENFVEEVLVQKLKVRKMFLGENARFGHGRQGDAALMQKLSLKYSFEFEEVRGVQSSGALVSSSRIRKCVQDGNLKEAWDCLGGPYSILAKVVKGDGRGASLGYPTANLEIDHEVMPPEGVYAVKVRQMKPSASSSIRFDSGPWLLGVMNFGKRPTFHPEDKAPQVAEVFILDVKDPSLYDQYLEVAFYERLRGEQVFSGADALKSQIASDINQARLILTS